MIKKYQRICGCLTLNNGFKNQFKIMELNRLREFLIDNVNSENIAIAIPESGTRIRVELLKWPLQETPSVSVMIENMDLSIGKESGQLKTVNFTTDHLETDLNPDDFHISEREGFVDTPVLKIQEWLSKKWNE